MKIIDCFLFFNELELLNYRLKVLNDYVDYFILVEMPYTFTGLPKQLFYNENKELFKEYHSKIIHIIVEDIPYIFPNINIDLNQQSENEFHQRNCIKRGIDIIIDKLNDDDIILSSDLDEIIDPKILEEFINGTYNLYISKDPTYDYLKDRVFDYKCSPLKFNDLEIYRVEADMYYCNLRSRRHYWHGIKLLTYKAYKHLNWSFQQMRVSCDNSSIIKNGGWHLSYFFNDLEDIITKFKSFSDVEYNTSYFLDKKNLQSNIDNYVNILNLTKLTYIPIEENNHLPPYYDTYLKSYL